MPRTPRVLLAPLDWGLGHATRSIAVGRALRLRGAELVLAGSGAGLAMMQEAFPEAESHELPGYEVRYHNRLPPTWAVLRQLPRLQRVIRAEQQWLQVHAAKLALNGIVSDNRYGLWQAGLPSVILCHQLVPPVRGWQRAATPLLQRAHLQYLRRFDQVWVPDLPDEAGMAGAMVPAGFPLPMAHIGWLSRLRGLQAATPAYLPADLAPPALLALLSGPEPLRSQLEAELREQAAHIPGGVWIVQGKPEAKRWPRAITGGLLIPYLDAAALVYWLRRAGAVLARSGFSSLMDFATLGLRRVLLTPTPGQPEQEYLATELARRAWAKSWEPGQPLATQLQTWEGIEGFPAHPTESPLLAESVGTFLRQLYRKEIP